MYIRFKIPIKINIISKTKDIETKINFQHDEYSCEMILEHDEVTSYLPGNKEKKFSIKCHSMNIIVKDNIEEVLTKFIDEDRNRKIFKKLCSFGNRCIRAIRNFGNISNIHELNMDFEESLTKYILSAFRVEKSEDRLNWEPLSGLDRNEELIHSLAFIRTHSFYYSIDYSKLNMDDNWFEVKRAIIEDLEIPPEREFTINALEHIHKNNMRLAVVEMVIGLEIILSKFLNNFLQSEDISQSRIKIFLKNEVGLTSKVVVLLDPIIRERFNFKKDDFDKNKIIELIHWRNRIMHGDGKLPTSISKTKIIDNILGVYRMCLTLGILNKQLEILILIKEVLDKHNVSRPIIWKGISNHEIWIRFNISNIGLKLNSFNNEITLALKLYSQIDSLFNIKKDLHISYVVENKTKTPIAIYKDGAFINLNK